MLSLKKINVNYVFALLIIIYFIVRLLLIVKSPIILGGDESSDLGKIIYKVIHGQWEVVLSDVHPRNYLSALMTGLITVPFYLAFPSSEAMLFLSVLTIHTFSVWVGLKVVYKHTLDISLCALFFLFCLISPVGISILSISNDAMGVTLFPLAIFLTIDCLVSERIEKKNMLLVAVFCLFVDTAFLPSTLYIFWMLVNSSSRKLQENIVGKNLVVAIFVVTVLQLFVLKYLWSKIVLYNNSIAKYNIAWALETFHQQFVGGHSYLLRILYPMNFLAMSVFITLLIFYYYKNKNGNVYKVKILTLYYVFLGFSYYLLKTEEPYANLPLAISSVYWQFWFYSSLFIIILSYRGHLLERVMWSIYFILLIMVNVYILFKGAPLNNFKAYNILTNYYEPDDCEGNIRKFYNLPRDKQKVAVLGCRARELDPYFLQSSIPTKDFFYFGLGLHEFYANILGKNFCSTFLNESVTSRCAEGYEFAFNYRQKNLN